MDQIWRQIGYSLRSIPTDHGNSVDITALAPFDSYSGRVEGDFDGLMSRMAPFLKVKTYAYHIILEDSSSGGRVAVYIKKDERGVLRLWCNA
ncbi:MAG: hypothetical protein ACP5UO_06500, partial [Thermoplasmata archaeon]